MPFGKHYNNIQIQQQTENIYQMEFWNTQLKITSKPRSKKLMGNTWKIERQVDRNIPCLWPYRLFLLWINLYILSRAAVCDNEVNALIN